MVMRIEVVCFSKTIDVKHCTVRIVPANRKSETIFDGEITLSHEMPTGLANLIPGKHYMLDFTALD